MFWPLIIGIELLLFNNWLACKAVAMGAIELGAISLVTVVAAITATPFVILLLLLLFVSVWFEVGMMLLMFQ